MDQLRLRRYKEVRKRIESLNIDERELWIVLYLLIHFLETHEDPLARCGERIDETILYHRQPVAFVEEKVKTITLHPIGDTIIEVRENNDTIWRQIKDHVATVKTVDVQ